MEKLKTFLKSKQAKTFYWQTANGVLLLAIAYLGELNYAFVPFLIPVLNYITKEINKNYM